jgi:hypothetical protein
MLGVTSVAMFRRNRGSQPRRVRSKRVNPLAQPRGAAQRFSCTRASRSCAPKTGMGSPFAVDASYSRRARRFAVAKRDGGRADWPVERYRARIDPPDLIAGGECEGGKQ